MSREVSLVREPLYLRVERDLTSRIADGVWAPGDFLPNEQALQERYRVSRTTIRKAVADLVASGLLVIERGSGTRVARPSTRRPASGLLSFSQTMRDLGRQPGTTRPHVCLTEAPPEMTGAHERFVHLSRVHTADDEPVSFSESWLPARLFAGLDLDRLGRQGSLYAELAALDLGVVEVADCFGLTTASQQEADALQVTAGVPLLLVERIGYTADHRPIESSRIVVCPDRYRPTVITRS